MSVTDLSERDTWPSTGHSIPCVSSGYGCKVTIFNRGIRSYAPGTEQLTGAETSWLSIIVEASLLENRSRIHHLAAILGYQTNWVLQLSAHRSSRCQDRTASERVMQEEIRNNMRIETPGIRAATDC